MESKRLKKIKECFAEGLYSCDDQGNIFSHFKGKKQLKGRQHKSGYVYYCFYLRGEEIQLAGHQAIWIYFHPNCTKLESLEINHKNLSKVDNRLANLEVVTSSDNKYHYHKMKKMLQDELTRMSLCA